ncbi:DSD1 family PLP-dependent enzyme [Francisella sp. 19X1-34]|uniref:DSD1 family PLP-dependent enzyme n=1 Tax=Francisella sp. 19X1-34 TaxID=3087177 RepID=UPI002E363A8F|nr:DSD1 family PLP-dependent enzyme [Francisella sp. 19X1-34]MED7787751.1 DSD1 family PLP-dependent enzyme [Francisella sp. 19X1-34]
MDDNLIGKHKLDLDTPCLVIDKVKLIDNIKRMQKFAKAKGKQVRPHAKTHKCPNICKLQLDHGSIGISIAKPTEALELAKAGIKGLLITSPIVTDKKLGTLTKILQLSPETIIVTDSLENIQQLDTLGKQLQQQINILVDIDAGISRTGVGFDTALKLAVIANKKEHLQMMGIQCYAGHLQHIKDMQQRINATEQLLNHASQLKLQIEQATGLSNLIQSGSGTGTFEIDCNIEGVTEIQPDSYTVMDKEYYDIDKTITFKAAMTLLTTVISTNTKAHVTVDAGTKAIYKETTLPQIISHPNLKYDWDGFGDEHGKVTGNNLPCVGEVIEMIVPHCDPTINLYDRFYVTENDIVTDIWDITLRGKIQ